MKVEMTTKSVSTCISPCFFVYLFHWKNRRRLFVATSNKKTTNSGKNNKKPGRPKRSAGKNGGQPPEEGFIRAEVLLIISFVLAVILLLSNFHLCGVAGDFLRALQLGTFGLVGFVMPLVLFVGVCFYMSNRGNVMAMAKMIAAVVALWTLCGFLQLFFGSEPAEGEGIMTFYQVSSVNGRGGGIFGGILCNLLIGALGKVGAFLVMFAGFVISAVFITEKSVVSVVKKHSDAAYQYAREDMGRRKELHAERIEERKRLREEQKVRGVDLDATLIEETEQTSGPQSLPAMSQPSMVQPQAELATASELLNQLERSTADVFTGQIALPPEYVDEDTVPFDVDEFIRREPAAGYVPAASKPVEPEGELEINADTGDYYPTETSEKGINYDGFFISEEARQVVTATGKIIETDTEALKKRFEKKKKDVQESDDNSVIQQIKEKEEEPKKEYVFPPPTLLKRGSRIAGSYSEKEYKETAIKLQQTLRDFGVGVTVTNISCGPSVTRYELHPEQGVKVSKIVGLSDDIKLSLAAEDIRIEAPISGKSAVGVEVPNKKNNMVYLRDLLEAKAFTSHSSRLAFAVGKDIGGQVVVTDIAKMPHLLIAGATGSGKSVCINTLIMSIIFKSSPDDVKLIMVDPKVVELSIYNGIPHLLIPVVTDPKKASGALNWAVAEMTDRYKKFADYNVRDLKGYNAKVENIKDMEAANKPKKLPQIVIIVDELADLMMVAPGEVEDAVCRLAQLARAAGIHLVIATQRPSVNVITGLIKANVPSRIAFAVSSGVDSRTIIDMNGAEKLLGKGDMLFYPAGHPKPQRVQGAFVSDQEVQKVVDFLTEQGMTSDYNPDVESQIVAAPMAAAAAAGGNDRDEYFVQAGQFIIEKEKASIGMLQRVFKIGFNRAARIMDQLAEAGVVGEEEGTKPRKVLMTMDEFDDLL